MCLLYVVYILQDYGCTCQQFQLDLPPLSVRITLRSILIMALMPQMRFHCESGGDIGWWCGGTSLDFQATSEPRPSVFQHFINTELIGQQHLTVAAVLLLFSSCFYASTFLPSPPPGEAPLSVRSDDKMQSGIRRLGVAMWFASNNSTTLRRDTKPSIGEDRTGRDRAGAVIHAAGKTPVQGQRERERKSGGRRWES
ncbi:hypothetical protein CMEL01_10773 [Colletotrichum melonis]|uniref:Uncharacterized protein n=1 Tax=Colletotrichum melonis TaxID=1209925 RepID=A0AAI9V065_9PEZI|nr:hypothetical protein CMEL01_10773 [Colletotrichum melonis]